MAVRSDDRPPLPSLRQLRCFLLAAGSGSIGSAADEAGLSQPAASSAIARLEEMFGAPLLTRHARGSTPTLNGELLQLRARRFFGLLAQGLAEAGADPERGRSSLNALRMVHLEALIAVAEAGTFTGAAKRLGVSGPALYRAARDVEKLLRAALFRVGPDGISTNVLGESLARHFRLALREIEQVKDEILGSTTEAPTVTLGILPLVSRRWIARAIAHFKRRHPGIAIGLREGDNAALAEEVRWGALDMIAGALAPARDPGFVQERLFADPYVVVVRQLHPLVHERVVTPDMLTRYAWIVPSHTLPRRKVLEAFFETLPQRPNIWLDTSSPGTMMTIVAETDCITLLSRTQILTDDPAHLAVLPVELPDSGRTVGLTSRAGWLPTPVQRDFLSSLKETMPCA